VTTPPGIPTGPIDTEPLDHRPSRELGAYDERIVAWFAEFADWGTFAVIASWIQRAATAER